MDNETVSERFRALLWGRLKPCWARRLRWAGAKTAGRKCWLGKETSEPCCRRTAASTSPSANVNLFFWPWPSTTGRVCEIRLGARRNSHVQATSLTEGGPRSRYGSSCSLPLTTSNRCCWSLSSPVVLCCSHSNSKTIRLRLGIDLTNLPGSRTLISESLPERPTTARGRRP